MLERNCGQEGEFFDCAFPPLHQPTDVVANGWPTGSHNLPVGVQKCRPRTRGLQTRFCRGHPLRHGTLIGCAAFLL
jgi:hypothetical protein